MEALVQAGGRDVVRSSALVGVKISVFVQMLAAGGRACIFGNICGFLLPLDHGPTALQ